jgi:hypothetical protein
MPASVCEEAVKQVARVLAPQGLFYADLISGDDSNHYREFAGDEVVAIKHEKDTIQSYFNFARIERTFLQHFELLDVTLVRQEKVIDRGFKARYHCTMRKRGK